NHEGKITLFDPASGTGNLLFVIMEQIKHELEVYASEVDPLLLKLSLVNANLQKKEVEFFHQDSLSPLLDRKSTRLNSSHVSISYAVFCSTIKKKLSYF